MNSKAKLFFLNLLIFSTTAFSDSTTLTQLSDSFETVAANVSPAVVEIYATGFGLRTGGQFGETELLTRQQSSGSGVLLDPEGYIMTNAHVIQGAQQVRVIISTTKLRGPRSSIIPPKGRMVEANVVGVDDETDLALLKIEATGLPYVKLADSDEVKPGQIVLAFGSPFGLENSLTMGIVSAVGRQLQPEDPMIYIQTDTPINPGNSGGPLVNPEGLVVGINTRILSLSGGNEGVGFAAPSNIVRHVYEQLRANGRVYRSHIGISAQTISPSLAGGLGLSQDWGVIVADVGPGEPAERAGLKIGDVILSLNGKVVENARQFEVNLYRIPEGESAKLQVRRGQETLSFQIPVQLREDSSNFRLLSTAAKNLIPQLGVYCIEMDDRIAKMLPQLRKQYGAVVAARAADAPWWSRYFSPGDVIHSLNGTLLKNLEELKMGLEKLKPGDAVVLQIERQGQLIFVNFDFE